MEPSFGYFSQKVSYLSEKSNGSIFRLKGGVGIGFNDCHFVATSYSFYKGSSSDESSLNPRMHGFDISYGYKFSRFTPFFSVGKGSSYLVGEENNKIYDYSGSFMKGEAGVLWNLPVKFLQLGFSYSYVSAKYNKYRESPDSNEIIVPEFSVKSEIVMLSLVLGGANKSPFLSYGLDIK